eukprot:3937265-Rhodomonas_salina.2
MLACRVLLWRIELRQRLVQHRDCFGTRSVHGKTQSSAWTDTAQSMERHSAVHETAVDQSTEPSTCRAHPAVGGDERRKRKKTAKGPRLNAQNGPTEVLEGVEVRVEERTCAEKLEDVREGLLHFWEAAERGATRQHQPSHRTGHVGVAQQAEHAPETV